MMCVFESPARGVEKGVSLLHAKGSESSLYALLFLNEISNDFNAGTNNFSC